MLEEESKDKTKKKIIIGSIIAIVLLLVLVLGATYAFFSLDVINSQTETNVNVTTGKLNNVAIKGTDNNTLHIKVSSEDMKQELKGTSYYATTDDNKDYLKENEEHNINIAYLEAEGDMNPTNICTAKLKVNISGELKDALQDGDTLLHIEGGRSKHNIDLSLLLDEYPIEFVVDKSGTQEITAYLKVTNRDADQTYIAGKTLSVTLTIEGLTCKVQNPDDAVEKILANSEQYLEKAEDVSLRGDVLRRFQGQVTKREDGTIENDINNYICFGTDKKEECTNDTDKYMYRIIGVALNNDETTNTKYGQLKLIKREALNSAQPWGETNQTWETSNLQIGLNDNLFLKNNSEYPYMQSGDTETEWSRVISSHDWGYGDLPINDVSGAGSWDANNNIEGQQMYKNEKAKWGSNKLSSTKIGLIYVSDYYLSATNIKCYNSNTYGECKKSWLHLSNNDTADLSTTKTNPTLEKERTMSRIYYGGAWFIEGIGNAGTHYLYTPFAVRPVFYLKSDLELSGSGAVDDPYIIQGVE